MPHSPERHIRLEAAYNVRDLGGYRTANGSTTRWRSLLRADALHELTDRDVEALLELGLRTVVDLRSDKEIAAQPSVFAAHDEVRYHHISLFDRLAPVDVMFRERGLVDLSERYIAAVDTCAPALSKVACAIAEAEDGVILFNCTAGKDRTGIIAAMFLSLAGVADDEIADDYALTGELAATLMQRLTKGAVQRGLDEKMATRLLSSEPAAMKAFLRHTQDQHGGFRNYLASKVEEDVLYRLEQRIVTPPPA